MTTPSLLSIRVLMLLLPLAASLPACAAEPFRYPEARSGKGELKTIAGTPVLLVQGKPEEIGEQLGVLALKPASGVLKFVDGFVKEQGWGKVYPWLLKTGGVMEPQFPRDHLRELEAAAKASGWPRDLLVFANTIPDLKKFGGCSVLIVEAGRSATGGPLFGRNLDWPPFGPLHELPLVVVCRPQGKLAFASVTYPGLLGVVSGMNEKGLAIADLTVTDAKDGSATLDVTGVPFTLAFRRVLEECSTVAEAEKLLRSLRRTIRQNIALCDKKGGAVLEVTPKTVVLRRPVEGICACTNHFRTEELATVRECRRYEILERSRDRKEFDVAAVAGRMDAVNQGERTLQTMVFEPSSLRLHLAMGKGPATRLPLRTLDLAGLLRPEEGRGDKRP
jgi:isopenicillin-N N-acyltransferase-like protein